MKLALVSTLLVTLVLTPRIAAHGWVASITVAGTAYQGPPLGTSSDLASVIRQVNTNSPVTSVSDPNLACGPNAQLAQDNADANPGDSIAVDWVSTAGAWFHDVGPMLTYLANCGSAPCNSGASATLSLPSNLAPGNYLLRHEIIALQNGGSQGGAEFYASCSQLRVGGSGTGAPTSSDLVKIPGAYSATDPGILVDVNRSVYMYTRILTRLTHSPGPPIASFIAGGDSTPPTNPPGTSSVPPGNLPGTSVLPSHSTTAPGRPTHTSAAASSPSGNVCRLRRSISSSPSAHPARTGAKRWLRGFPMFRK
ncbi:glycoside hydrolase family 61 protein [Mycena olivaceomarginata]|nr:glycoside hydrolase family 61 protein [Mycena olivaceomarginata]